MAHRWISLAVVLFAAPGAFAGGPILTLSQQLSKEEAEVLAKAAREQGDATPRTSPPRECEKNLSK